MKILKIIFLGEIDFKIKLKFFFRYGTNIHVRKIFMSYGDMSFVAHFVIIKNLKRTSEEKKLWMIDIVICNLTILTAIVGKLK